MQICKFRTILVWFLLLLQGLITDSDKDSILKGLDDIERQIEADKFEWRTDREDVHMNIEAALTDLIGEPAKKLHTARSRNDQVATDFRLWCRDAIDTIIVKIKNLQTALVALALKNEALIVPGYTHLQRAQPVLLPHVLLTYVEQVLNFSFAQVLIFLCVGFCLVFWLGCDIKFSSTNFVTVISFMRFLFCLLCLLFICILVVRALKHQRILHLLRSLR